MPSQRILGAFLLGALLLPASASALPAAKHDPAKAVDQLFDAAHQWNSKRIAKADKTGRPLRLHPILPLSWRKGFLVKSWDKRNSLLNSFVSYLGGRTPKYDYIKHFPEKDLVPLARRLFEDYASGRNPGQPSAHVMEGYLEVARRDPGILHALTLELLQRKETFDQAYPLIDNLLWKTTVEAPAPLATRQAIQRAFLTKALDAGDARKSKLDDGLMHMLDTADVDNVRLVKEVFRERGLSLKDRVVNFRWANHSIVDYLKLRRADSVDASYGTKASPADYDRAIAALLE